MLPDSEPAKLNHRDQRYLDAAEGWIGLGNWQEAHEELENISPQNRAQPEVLALRWDVYSEAEKWEGAYEIARALSEAVPTDSFGVTSMAIALREMARTEEAWALLLSIVDRFPNDHRMRYTLACYACELGKLQEAVIRLRRAFELSKDLRAMALDDPGLQQVWVNIGSV